MQQRNSICFMEDCHTKVCNNNNKNRPSLATKEQSFIHTFRLQVHTFSLAMQIIFIANCFLFCREFFHAQDCHLQLKCNAFPGSARVWANEYESHLKLNYEKVKIAVHFLSCLIYMQQAYFCLGRKCDLGEGEGAAQQWEGARSKEK